MARQAYSVAGSFPPVAGGGKTNPGLLTIEFRAGDKAGLYHPTVQLIGGNSHRFTLEAQAPG